MKILNASLFCGLIAFSGFASANVDSAFAFKSASADKLFVANAGEVMVTFISKTAAYSNDLFLMGKSNKVLNNQNSAQGQQFSLGSFQAGAELAFKIVVNTTGDTFFSGLGNLNADNVVHSAFKINTDNTVTMGFEDIMGGGDKDYDDIVFSLSNVQMSNAIVASVPEAQNYAMLLAGLCLIGAIKRRRN